MGQQPNVEVTEATAPWPIPEPGAARKWRAAKPGVPEGPADVPRGGHFGATGPDPGWALKLVGAADLPDEDPRLKSVVTGLVLARAATSGRAPISEDIDAALVLCGYDEEAGPELIERREGWLAAVPHEKRPGETAVSEVDRDLISAKPEQIRYAYRLSKRG